MFKNMRTKNNVIGSVRPVDRFKVAGVFPAIDGQLGRGEPVNIEDGVGAEPNQTIIGEESRYANRIHKPAGHAVAFERSAGKAAGLKALNAQASRRAGA